MAKSRKRSRGRLGRTDRASTVRRRERFVRLGCGVLTALCLVVLVVLQFVPPPHAQPEETHAHPPPPHGGFVVPIGTERAHYHAEWVVGPTGAIELHMLGPDPFPPLAVDPQHVTVDVLADHVEESVPVILRPAPESGPPDGPTSRFLGRLPPDLLGRRLTFRVPELVVGEQRLTFTTTWQSTRPPAEHAALVAAEQDRVYRTPAGRYTEGDIVAAGRKTAVERYRSYRGHRLVPAKAGEAKCPVTRMKADTALSWTVGGRQYRFCCPGCIDEFVLAARERPEEIKVPEEYDR
jgi:hypothetical protein